MTKLKYDRAAVIRNTVKAPAWLHFGAGNIFRGFVADLQQTLLEQGASSTGIIAAEVFDPEIIERTYTPFDNLTILVVLRGDGTFEKRVIGSVAESLSASSPRLLEIAAAPSLQMVSFTITEKGYSAGDAMNVAAGLLLHRYKSGACPLSMVSMDNCSHNGDKLKNAIETIAEGWVSAGVCDEGFLAYLRDREKIGFPYSMIDKITPNPSQKVLEMLRADGMTSMEIIRTAKGSCAAPFVNAEKAQYLVIEDWFPNGRPPLERAGVHFTDRQTVDRVEKMKVCTCLNPLHTALAVLGCLLGFDSISAEMRDPDLSALVRTLGVEEGLPVVIDPGIINPRDFLEEVLTERLPNPNLPDTPQRIACDTSQKVGIRFGETLKAYKNNARLEVSELRIIPFVIAAWCRYLLGKDDNWNAMERSPDPLLNRLSEHLAGVTLGESCNVHSHLEPILSDSELLGVNMYELRLGKRVEDTFARMIAEKGAVRGLLHSFFTSLEKTV